MARRDPSAMIDLEYEGGILMGRPSQNRVTLSERVVAEIANLIEFARNFRDLPDLPDVDLNYQKPL